MDHPAARWILPVLLVLGLGAACTPPAAPTSSLAPKPIVATTPKGMSQVDALLSRLTLEQKVGQLMMIDVAGLTFDEGLREMLEKHQVGGVIFFARNVESPAQVAQLTNELQTSALKGSGIGLFVAIDQEGGRVARLTANKGFTEFPGAMALSAAASNQARAADQVHQVGEAMAVEMRAVGINTDFAPDLDVNNNPANPVIGVRSFGSDPQRVAALGTAFIDGLQGKGVLAFGKHFPGHGDTGTDSHLDLPVVKHSRARLEVVEFVPFKAAIAANAAGIMSAHISFPTIDDTPGLPATLSAKVLTGLLRDELRFTGLIATDSLEMGALGRSGFPPPCAAARALQSGADLLLFNSGHKVHQAVIAEIIAEVRDGTIPLSRLNDAVRHVLRAKERFGLLQPQPVDSARATEVCGSAEHRALAAKLSAASITLLRDNVARLPLAKGVVPIVVAVPSAAKLTGLIGGIEVRISENPSERETAEAMAAVATHPGAPVVITLSGAASLHLQAELARKLIATGAPIILAAVREPYDLIALATPTGAASAPTLIASYGANPPALEALAAVLRGAAKPAGHLPVDLPGLSSLGAGMDHFARTKNPR